MSETDTQEPAIFHLTHWKAGSQWVKGVIGRAAGERWVRPQKDSSHLRPGELRPGAVYSPVYMGRKDFLRTVGDLPHRRFFVIRDLRDTLVSWYFSLRFSHPAKTLEFITTARSELQDMEFDEGLESLICGRLAHIATIQRSWVRQGEFVVRYEDMLNDQQAVFAAICDHVGISIRPRVLEHIVNVHSFEQRTGRSRGEEDVASHRRKGVAGDWHNHFSERIKDLFKEKFGQHLVYTGYEEDLDW